MTSPPVQYVRHFLAQALVRPEAEQEHDEELCEEYGETDGVFPEPGFAHERFAESFDEVRDGVDLQDGGDRLVFEVVDIEEDTGDPEECKDDRFDQVREVLADGGNGSREQGPGREERVGQEQIEEDLQMVQCRRVAHDQRDDVDDRQKDRFHKEVRQTDEGRDGRDRVMDLRDEIAVFAHAFGPAMHHVAAVEPGHHAKDEPQEIDIVAVGLAVAKTHRHGKPVDEDGDDRLDDRPGPAEGGPAVGADEVGLRHLQRLFMIVDMFVIDFR